MIRAKFQDTRLTYKGQLLVCRQTMNNWNLRLRTVSFTLTQKNEIFWHKSYRILQNRYEEKNLSKWRNIHIHR